MSDTNTPAARPNRALKFRDDIDPSNTWLVSDTHFGHDNIVGFCHRPEDHEQVMIAEWRAHVPDDATVLHLGDFSYRGNARVKNLIARELTGARKLLIKGNHDGQRYSFYRACGFQIVSPFAIGYSKRPDEVLPGGAVRSYPWEHIVSFSHYPWADDDGRGKLPAEQVLGHMADNHTRIHGHIHNNGYTRDGFVPFLRNHINISVEQMKYRPVNLKLLLDAALLGTYPETTQAQLDDAAARKEAHRA